MKILMVFSYIPWPLHGGSSVRVFNLAKELSALGHEIYLLAGSKDESRSIEPELFLAFKKIFLYKSPGPQGMFSKFFKFVFYPAPYPAQNFCDKNLTEKAAELIKENHFDLVWINFSILAGFMPYSIIEEKKIPVVLDQHELEELVYQDYLLKGGLKEKMAGAVILAKLKKFKKKIFPHISAFSCVSETETELAKKQLGRQGNFFTVPNGVDISEFFPGKQQEEGKIVFCGNIGVKRNEEAVLWFAKKIFPAIKQKRPDAEFLVVGAGKSKKINKLKTRPGVSIIGEVADIRDFYKKGRVFVSPYKFGAGTKLKVLEAMASGVPVVSTPVGCRGINAKEWEEILVTGNAEDFAEKTLLLLENPGECIRISENAFKMVSGKYAWKTIALDLEKEILKLKK